MKTLVPWKKKDNFIAPFKKELGELLDRFFEGRSLMPGDFFSQEQWFPRVDISEGKKNVTVKAEVPGLDVKDIDVSLSGRHLTIKGEKKQEKEQKDENFHRIERSYGSFHRTIELPSDVNESSVNAVYKKGVLEITLEKIKETETKTISVNTE